MPHYIYISIIYICVFSKIYKCKPNLVLFQKAQQWCNKPVEILDVG